MNNPIEPEILLKFNQTEIQAEIAKNRLVQQALAARKQNGEENPTHLARMAARLKAILAHQTAPVMRAVEPTQNSRN